MALVGLSVCGRHGGGNARSRAKSQRIVAEHRAGIACRKFGVPIETTASDALRGELYRSAGIVAWFEEQLAATPAHMSGLVAAVEGFGVAGDDQMGNGPALALREEHTSFDAQGNEVTKIRLVENPLLSAFRKERDHLARVAADCVRIGLEEAVVKAQIAQARLQIAPVLEVLRGVADDPELADVASRVRAAIGRHVALKRAAIEAVAAG